MSKLETTLQEKMRLMADGAKEHGAIYEYPELLRLGANRIDALEDDIKRLHSEKMDLIERSIAREMQDAY